MSGRPWTEDEINTCPRHVRGWTFYEIDKALGRRPGSTKRRFEGVGYGSGQKRPIPARLLDERKALTAARNQRMLTQNFCGDPPPGYSALHGKTGQDPAHLHEDFGELAAIAIIAAWPCRK